MRVVSLVPSSTETLLALGADVVACTRFCEQPDLVHVGGTKNPDVDAIVALGPDLVVLDREENRREDADALRAAGLELFVTSVSSLADALAVPRRLAEAAGVAAPEPGATEAVVRPEPLGLDVFVPIWRRPWMTIGAATYGGDLLAWLGCRVVGGDGSAAYPEVTLDQVASCRPDVVVVPSEPYEFSDAHCDELAAAVPDARIVRVEGQDLFWWGSRTPQAVARLAAVLACSR